MIKVLDKEGLNKDEYLKENYLERYTINFDKYDILGQILQQDLKKLLKDKKIDYLSVNYRIKDFDSFWDKIRRKKDKYDNPFDEIEDICGLRIICYYISDLDKITSLIKKEFEVLEIIDKAGLLKDDEFEYLSLHFIVKLNESWLKAPSYRDLGDLKAEIQVRTILQHAWADISHKLVYKKKIQIPSQFKRKLNSLSCILENSDIQFDSLKDDRTKYISKISGKATFDLNQELNLDSLQAFLDFYFPDRVRDINEAAELLDEILTFNKDYGKQISLKTILEAYNETKDNIAIEEVSLFNKIDQKEVEQLKEKDPDRFKELYKNSEYFVQVGLARVALTYYDDDYNDYWEKKADEESD